MDKPAQTNGQGGDTLDDILKHLDPKNRVEHLGAMLEQIRRDKQERDMKQRIAEASVPTVPNGKRTVSSNGHDKANGRFTAGNQAARGRANPHARKQAALRAVLAEAVGEDRLRTIAVKLADLAAGGDLEAMKLLFVYLMGKPGAAPDPDRLDLDEWKILDAQPTTAELLRALLHTVDVNKASDKVSQKLAMVEAQEAIEKRSENDIREVIMLQDGRCGRKRKAAPSLS